MWLIRGVLLIAKTHRGRMRNSASFTLQRCEIPTLTLPRGMTWPLALHLMMGLVQSCCAVVVNNETLLHQWGKSTSGSLKMVACRFRRVCPHGMFPGTWFCAHLKHTVSPSLFIGLRFLPVGIAQKWWTSSQEADYPDAVWNQAESCSTSLTMAQVAEELRHSLTRSSLDPSSEWWPCWWLNDRHNTEGHTVFAAAN